MRVRQVIAQTPAELLERGIYSRIATSLKAGEWRKVSYFMLVHELAEGIQQEPKERGAIVKLKKLSKLREKIAAVTVRRSSLRRLTAREGSRSAEEQPSPQEAIDEEQDVLTSDEGGAPRYWSATNWAVWSSW